MASGRCGNSTDGSQINVRIKIEPGTSTSKSFSEKALLSSVKMESKLPITNTNTQRLTSFRVPRDLTLGGNIKTEKPKKVYIPNLDLQRNKNRSEAIPVNADSVKSVRDGGLRGRGRGRGDRGRGKANLIQSKGIWSEGIHISNVRRRSNISSSSSIDNKKSIEKLSTNKTSTKTVNLLTDSKDEDEWNNLVNDLSDNNDNHDNNVDSNFLTLPIKEEKLYKKENKIGETDTYNDEEDVDEKPIILENGEAIDVQKQKFRTNISTNLEKNSIKNKINSFKLIKFPNNLPGLELDNQEESKTKRPNNSKANVCNKNDKVKSKRCTLNDLQSGLIGHLEILESGKMRLCLGENTLIVNFGVEANMRQDLVFADIEDVSSAGKLYNYGPINDTLICSPNLEAIL